MKKIGLVKWFNAQKSYGFIKPVDGGFDVYVHIKSVQQAGWVELKEGHKICFDSGWMNAPAQFRRAFEHAARSTFRGGSTPVDRRGRGPVLEPVRENDESLQITCDSSKAA